MLLKCYECGRNVPMNETTLGYCSNCSHLIGVKRESVLVEKPAKQKKISPKRHKCAKCDTTTTQELCSKCKPKIRKTKSCTRCGKSARGELCSECKRLKSHNCKCGRWISKSKTTCLKCEKADKLNALPNCKNPTHSPKCRGKATGKNDKGLCSYCLVLWFSKYSANGEKRIYNRCGTCGIPTRGKFCKPHAGNNVVVGKCPNKGRLKACKGVYRKGSKSNLCTSCRKNKMKRLLDKSRTCVV